MSCFNAEVSSFDIRFLQ